MVDNLIGDAYVTDRGIELHVDRRTYFSHHLLTAMEQSERVIVSCGIWSYSCEGLKGDS